MAGLGPATHEPRQTPCWFPWMPGTRSGKTTRLRLNGSECIGTLAVAARVVPPTELMLGACVSQSACENQGRSCNRLVRSQRRSKPNLPKSAGANGLSGDMLFAEGSFELTPKSLTKNRGGCARRRHYLYLYKL